jgi:hypothetical protein
MSQNLDSEFPLEFLDEGIRQTCLWNDIGLPFNLGGGPGASPKEAWFQYAELWKTECLQNWHGKFSLRSGSKNFSANECSKKIAKRMGIDWYQLQNCVKGSFEDQTIPEVSQVKSSQAQSGLVGPKKSHIKWQQTNSILQRGMSANSYSSIYIVPAVLINDLMYSGNMDSFLVAEAICDSFYEKPLGCQELTLGTSEDVRSSDKEGVLVSKGVKVVPHQRDVHIIALLLGIGLASVAVLGAIVIIAKMYFSREARGVIETEVREVVGDYIKIRDTETDANPRA